MGKGLTVQEFNNLKEGLILTNSEILECVSEMLDSYEIKSSVLKGNIESTDLLIIDKYNYSVKIKRCAENDDDNFGMYKYVYGVCLENDIKDIKDKVNFKDLPSKVSHVINVKDRLYTYYDKSIEKDVNLHRVNIEFDNVINSYLDCSKLVRLITNIVVNSFK